MDYKKVLLLAYFNTIQASYSYKEIGEIFGLSSKQVENIIDELYVEKLLILKGYYKLSSKAKNILDEHGLKDVDFFEIDEESNIFVNTPLGFNDIYIPIGFTKKVK
ncbi:sigma-70 region 4 domain-containing protein [Priestia flexa]|uniref:sigma-70 region 4 domain-containing protein n=1 Tax=Priestia flexa TaxID=86664 RepID=UPI001B33F681|nr:sigma-70 region 4 domain-containing protein [Priestia flexa]